MDFTDASIVSIGNSSRDSVELSREIRESFREDIAHARAKEDELAQQLAELDAALSRLKRQDCGPQRSRSLILDSDSLGDNLTSTPISDRKRSCFESIQEATSYMDTLNARSPILHDNGSACVTDARSSIVPTSPALVKSDAELKDDDIILVEAIPLDQPDGGRSGDHMPVSEGEESSALSENPSHHRDNGATDTIEKDPEAQEPTKKGVRMIRVETIPRTAHRHEVPVQATSEESSNFDVALTGFTTPLKKSPRSLSASDTDSVSPPAVTVLSPINESSPQLVKAVKVHSRSPMECQPGGSPISVSRKPMEINRRHSAACHTEQRRPSASRRPYRLTEL